MTRPPRRSAKTARPRASRPTAPRGAFEEVFAKLRAVLVPYGETMSVRTDDAKKYYLSTGKTVNKKPVFFGAVGIMKNYVSFHLMPVYVFPDLLGGVSEALRARMQGKSCFNFREIDPAALRELASLAKAGHERFRGIGLT